MSWFIGHGRVSLFGQQALVHVIALVGRPAGCSWALVQIWCSEIRFGELIRSQVLLWLPSPLKVGDKVTYGSTY